MAEELQEMPWEAWYAEHVEVLRGLNLDREQVRRLGAKTSKSELAPGGIIEPGGGVMSKELTEASVLGKPVAVIDYTNHRGERARRLIVPVDLVHMRSDHHQAAEWILVAFCLDRKAERHFKMTNIHTWER